MTCPHCQRALSAHTVDDQCLNAWAAVLRKWTDVRFSKRCGFWLGHQPNDTSPYRVPQYTTSIAEAFALEESLPVELREDYYRNIAVATATNRNWKWAILHASAYHRTVAFVAAMQEKDDGE